ncbi:proline iminopeptidase-family hydrolase [bacterium]|nr:proline iminopeptidase-family hydrolase [bacterium]
MAVVVWGDDRSTGLVPGEGFVEVIGGKVWYKIVGNGKRTPLLVLHGGPGVPSVYLRPLEALATDRQVIFYDQLGCGNSPGASDTAIWTIERFVGEIAQLREALGLKEVHLYGHSWGTMLAVDYVLNRPAGVSSLVLASPVLSVPRWSRDADSLLGILPDSLQEVIRRHKVEKTTDSPEYQSAVMVYYRQYLARRQPWSDDLNSAFAQLNQAMYRYMWGPSEFIVTGTLSDYDRTNRLGEITTPTLLTAGQFDEATPATVRYYQSLIPGSEIAILEKCGHMTMHDDPETDIRVIREFLAKIESE